MTIELLEGVESVRRARTTAKSLEYSSLKRGTSNVTPGEQSEADRVCEGLRLDCLSVLRDRPYNKWSGAVLKAMTYATLGLPGIVGRRKLGHSIEEDSYQRRLEVDLPVDYGNPVRTVVFSSGREVSEATQVTVSIAERPDFLLLKPGHGEVWYERFLGRGGAYIERLRRANLEDAVAYHELTSEILSQGR